MPSQLPEAFQNSHPADFSNDCASSFHRRINTVFYYLSNFLTTIPNSLGAKVLPEFLEALGARSPENWHDASVASFS
jgi:hypothetical protein